MVWFVVDLLTTTRRPDRDKDMEIVLLRHQLRLPQRERSRPPRLSRWEKLTLAVLTATLTHLAVGPRPPRPGPCPVQAGDCAEVASGADSPHVDHPAP